MAPAESSGPSKRRKVGGGELEMFQLKNRRQLLENSGNSTASNDQYSSPSSDHVLASCCSSNGSSEVSNEKLNFTDLEEVNVQIETSTNKFGCRERRQTTPLSELGAQTDELESTVRPSEVNSRRQSTTEKMPTDAQLEEFFDVAEKNLQKQFTDKYNYDIAKDEPLDGRYEWVRLNP